MQAAILLLLITNFVPNSWMKNTGENVHSKQNKPAKIIKLPACQACKMITESFNKELLEITQKVLENKNKNQEEPTTRESDILQDVFVNMCSEERAQDQCRTLVEKCKLDLQEWWLIYKSEVPDLIQYLCIDKLHYCCPIGHYGPNCNPCPGYPGHICYNNGKCKGNGTRKGNGQCTCDVGYTGRMCDECAPSYYVSYKDDNKMLCARCHSSCEANCTQAGSKGCLVCREGWRMDKSRGCLDVNECISKRPPCKRNEFCVNNEGSYSCLACDPSCDTCNGDGPDMCEKCANGFVLKDNICVNQKHYVSYSDVTRYLTYMGLWFATYIIFQNSPWAASLIGICVAVYVTVSEYMLGTLTSENLLSFRILDGLEHMWRSD